MLLQGGSIHLYSLQTYSLLSWGLIIAKHCQLLNMACARWCLLHSARACLERHPVGLVVQIPGVRYLIVWYENAQIEARNQRRRARAVEAVSLALAAAEDKGEEAKIHKGLTIVTE
jgi:hypothetical protein